MVLESGTTFFRFIKVHTFDIYGQTDGRTDSFLVARPRCIQCMQRGNNMCSVPASSQSVNG